jgi:hypothetical protein
VSKVGRIREPEGQGQGLISPLSKDVVAKGQDPPVQNYPLCIIKDPNGRAARNKIRVLVNAVDFVNVKRNYRTRLLSSGMSTSRVVYPCPGFPDKGNSNYQFEQETGIGAGMQGSAGDHWKYTARTSSSSWRLFKAK